jgi:hypothetical protein
VVARENDILGDLPYRVASVYSPPTAYVQNAEAVWEGRLFSIWSAGGLNNRLRGATLTYADKDECRLRWPMRVARNLFFETAQCGIRTVSLSLDGKDSGDAPRSICVAPERAWAISGPRVAAWGVLLRGPE